jgi:hypothetical protein
MLVFNTINWSHLGKGDAARWVVRTATFRVINAVPDPGNDDCIKISTIVKFAWVTTI